MWNRAAEQCAGRAPSVGHKHAAGLPSLAPQPCSCRIPLSAWRGSVFLPGSPCAYLYNGSSAGCCLLELLAAASKGWNAPRSHHFFVGITLISPGNKARPSLKSFSHGWERELVKECFETHRTRPVRHICGANVFMQA